MQVHHVYQLSTVICIEFPKVLGRQLPSIRTVTIDNWALTDFNRTIAINIFNVGTPKTMILSNLVIQLASLR